MFLVSAPAEKQRMDSLDDLTYSDHYKSIRSPPEFEQKSNMSYLISSTSASPLLLKGETPIAASNDSETTQPGSNKSSVKLSNGHLPRSNSASKANELQAEETQELALLSIE
jgi:hypothetical protein